MQPLIPTFPATRYWGSKAKLVDFIWDGVRDLEFDTVLDAFGGTGVVSHMFKQRGKAVTYNDVLGFNWRFGMALIANDDKRLTDQHVEMALDTHEPCPTFVADTFSGIYYTDEENRWIDRVNHNINHVMPRHEPSLYVKFGLWWCLAQSCVVKRPFNLFHRANLSHRFADVERHAGNKTSWDTPFEEWFRRFVDQFNGAVTDGDGRCRAFCRDARLVRDEYDLVYIDPPYVSGKGQGTDYADMYHFLEGLCDVDGWADRVDWNSRHLRMIRRNERALCEWTDPDMIVGAFWNLFERFKGSVLVVSYRSDGIPSVDQIVKLMGAFKTHVDVHQYGAYRYGFSTNRESEEVLVIGR